MLRHSKVDIESTVDSGKKHPESGSQEHLVILVLYMVVCIVGCINVFHCGCGFILRKDSVNFCMTESCVFFSSKSMCINQTISSSPTRKNKKKYQQIVAEKAAHGAGRRHNKKKKFHKK